MPSFSLHKSLPAIAAIALIFCKLVHGQANGISPAVITNFAKGAKLTSEEVQTVLQLAAKAGLKQPREVRTFNYLPTTAFGICVQSIDHRIGRRLTFKKVILDSSKFGRNRPNPLALHLQDFWVDPPYVTTNLLLNVTISGKAKNILISEEIKTETADKILNGIGSALDRYAAGNKFDNSAKHAATYLSDLESLIYDSRTKEYHLKMGFAGGYIINCKLENDEVVILYISEFIV